MTSWQALAEQEEEQALCEAAHGEYRTKHTILEIYDEMARAVAGGEPYRTRLDSPPADPRVAHQERQPDHS